MTYPDSFVQKIGFDTIIGLLQKECITESARAMCTKIAPLHPFEKLQTYLKQTAEFKSLLMLEAAFPAQDYFDLSDELKRLQVQGSYITLEGLGRLRASYVTLCEIKSYFDKLDAETYPQLCLFAQQLEIIPEVLPKIDTLLTRTGEIRDNASENLFRIRQLIRRKSGETQRYIVKYMDLAKKEGWVEDEADVTVRNERLVIPVTASHKKSMRGFIHDVSATGQTVFMEPEEIFNLNNEIVELRNEERVEIIEILKNFSAFLRPFLGVLTAAYRFLVRVDVLRGKALLAVKLDAGMPILHNKPCFVWRQARHPLLYLKDPKAVVPLDLSLADEERIVVISGPNAGGKSVCLKTVGLLQYMLQCGLLVSMREDSEAGVVRDIFVDIGDEQSIENDLSTYSSHLKNMKFWVEHADKNTLFLSDELGSGTEPQVGGAIAEALVEFLLRKGARGIITTHYTNLKLMAKSHPGIVNGAMLFDQENLRPLYVFRKGLPGSSFAFEIARKTGLPESVLAAAENKVGRRQLNFEQELQQIEVEKHVLHKKRQEVEVADDLLHSTLQKYKGLLHDLETHRTRLMNEAKAEARSLVKQANADIERTIREIREAQAEKEATRRARQVLNEKAAEWEETKSPEIEGEQPKKPAEEAKPNGIPLREGAWARLKDSPRTVGRIEKIQDGTARVNFDYMRMQLSFDKLVALTEKESLQYEKNLGRGSVKVENLSEGQLHFKPRIDLRGVRGEEAVEKTLRLVDQAVLYGEKHLEILHGKGNGILRQLIRGALSKNPHVQSFSDQEEQFGGSGITLVHLS